MANNTEDIKWLYDKLKAKGYDIGNEQEFSTSLANEDDRKWYYEKATGMGLDMGSMDDFNALYAPVAPASQPKQGKPVQIQSASQGQTPATETAAPQQTAQPPVSTPAPAPQPTWQPTEQEKIRMSHSISTMLNDFRQQSQARIEQARRATMPMTTEGRRKLKAGKFQAQLAGTPTKMMGLTPNVRTAETATAGEGQGAAETTAKPLESAQSPVPYGVRYVNGKPVTEWLLPDGTLTTDLVEADKAEYGARTVRLRNQFVDRMKQNGLDPSKQEDVQKQSQIDAETEETKFIERTSEDANNVVAELWQEAEEKHKADKNANADREWSRYAAMGGGREMRVVTASANRHADQVSHMTRFDLEKMMETTWARVGNRVTAQCYNRLRTQYPQATEEELQKAATDMARGLTDNAVFQYAVKQNTPKSTLEYFGRTVADANVLNSIGKGLARSQAGTSGDLAAYEQAMGEYGKNHRVAQIGGTVAGMAIDPVTYISGGVGSLFGKGAMWAGGRFLASRAAGMSAQAGTRLFSSSLSGRLLTRAAAGAGNFMTFDTLKEAENQFLHGGHINEHGENEGYSAQALLKSAGKGLILGGVTGTMTPLLGNVTDKAVKATQSTAGKVGLRATELGVSTIAEGTVFALPEWYENSKREDGDPNKQDNFDIWTDNLAMMLGFKVSHGIKSAPRVIASLRPIKPADGRPLTQAERNHNRMNFEERVRKALDPANPNNLTRNDDAGRVAQAMRFTADEREELRRAGYGELADIFSRDREQTPSQPNPADGAIELRTERAEAEEIRNGNPEFDGYSDMERLMQDGRVSQAARAKAYYVLTGRMLPMGTVTGWTKDIAEDGRVTINAVTADGEVVTSRTFANEKAAKQETNNISRQAELNSVEVGERYREALADEMLLEESISQVSPGADMETVKRIYRAVKAGNNDMTEDQAALAGFIDEAIERNRDMADRHRPEAIRAELREEYGIEVDDALRKTPDKRTAKEKEIVQTYLERLFPEEARERAEEPTPEQEEAQGLYEEGKLLYGRYEEGDPEVTAEVDAIVIRMQEANQIFEDAFGAESEYYRFHLNENPWGLINDPALTAEQQEAVLYYINAKAALDGVLDASNEAAADKRQKVQGEVAHRTHKERGVIVPAMMKEDDRPAYIIKGDVAMFPDGSGVDVRNSSDSLIILDESGEYKFTSPNQILSVGEAIDPQTELQTAYEAIDREQEAIINAATEGVPEMGENVPNIAETAEIPTENRESGTENVPNSLNPEGTAQETAEEDGFIPVDPALVPNYEEAPSALERIPVDEQTGDPILTHESVDADTAWEAATEFFGTPEDALTYVQAEIGNAKTAITTAEKAVSKVKPTGGMTKYREDLKSARDRVEAAKNTLAKWEAIEEAQKRSKAEEAAARLAETAARNAQLHDEAVARFEEEQRIQAEKQAEQERIGTHAIHPKIKEKWEASPKVDGHPDVITLPDGSALTGHYVMTEAGAASASHDVNNAFEPTEGFPIDKHGQSVNDRDYKRDRDAQQIVYNMADAYDSRAVQTPVIVSKDGIVLSGNNRTMSGDIAATQGTDGAYLEYLGKYGAKYGFTPEQVATMKHPRVVFVPDEDLPYDAKTFSRFNAQEMKSQSKPEAAIKLGKIVDDATFNRIVADLNKYDRLSDFYADQEAAARTLGELAAAGVINDKQLPELRTGTALSAAGKELIENTLIGKVFQAEPDAVRMIISMPALRQAVILGLNEIAHNRTLTEKGYDLAKELSAAVDLVFRARTSSPDIYKDGIPVSPFGRQQGLFDDEYGESRVTDTTTLLLADLLNSTKPSDVRKVLAMYNKSAGESAAGAVDIFSETGKPDTKEEILSRVNELFSNGTAREKQELVDAAIADRKQRSSAESAGRGGDEAAEQAADAGRRGEGGEERIGNSGDAGRLGREASGDLQEIASESSETDENGLPFIIAEDGTTSFGYINEESGLTPAPIKLSEGFQDETTGKGYGLVHIEAGHGEQIRAAGFKNVRDFVGFVAKNYDPDNIRVGKRRGNGSGTFLIQVTDKHDNTLFVELSKDGAYWNVNSGGIFRKGYSNKKETVAKTEPQQPNYAVSSDSSLPAGEQSGKSSAEPNGKSTVSDGKDNALPGNKQGKGAESSLRERISEAEQEVDLSPTEAQKRAGNYKKGHVQVGTFDVTIENPAGSKRSGTDAEGKKWETTMTHTYGYIRGTEGVDGDHIDVFVSSDIDGWNGRKVFVVDQYNPDGSFDEHKVMLGFNDREEAYEAYLSNYEEGWENGRRLECTEVIIEDFERWIGSSKRKTKPFAEYKSVKALTEEADQTRTNINRDGIVTDGEGKPLTLYHGTPNKRVTSVSQLEPGHKRMGEEAPARFNGDGVSFTPERSVAQDYATVTGHGKGWIFPANIRLSNPYYTLGVANFTPEEAAEFTAGLKAKGHDGIINYPSASMREAGALPAEVIVFDKSAILPIEDNDLDGLNYTITPTTYTNKKGKRSDVWLVKFDLDLSDEEKRALEAYMKEPLAEGEKTPRGWYDRKEGGYMMRSEEAAKGLAGILDHPEGVADAQPLSAEDYKEAIAPAAEEGGEPAKAAPGKKGTAPAPMNRVDVEGLFNGLSTKGETKLSDHSAPGTPESAPGKDEPRRMIVDDEMRGMEDVLRSLLGIDDSEGDRGNLFRNPEDFTNEERMQITSVGIVYALKYFDQGIVSFPDFADRMVRRMGEKIRPWLKAFYGGARDIPGYDHLPFTPADEVKAFDVMNFDKENKDADPMRMAQGIVAESRAEAAVAEAKKEITEQRNQKRKENEKRRRADTEAIADEGEAIAGEAERLAKDSEDEAELNRTTEKIDEALEKVDEQLALLGYYEGDGDMAKAEAKAARAGAELGARLMEDLGLDVSTLPKDTELSKSNFHASGGFLRINLPTGEGYEPLQIEIRFDRGKDGSLHLSTVTTVMKRGGADSYISGEDRKLWLSTPTYGKLLDTVREQMGEYLPKEEAFEVPEFWHDKSIAELEKMLEEVEAKAGSKMGKSFGMDKIARGLTQYIEKRKREKAQERDPETGEISALQNKESESVNGYKRGDEVMWDRYGNGKWEKVIIADYDADGSPIFDTMPEYRGVLMEKGDWSRVRPADGVFGEAKRVVTQYEADKKRAENSKESAFNDATERGLNALTGGKGRKSRRKDVTLKAEEPVGGLFADIFDEPETVNKNERGNGNKPGQGLAGGERAHTVGDDETGTDGRVPTAGTEPTGKGGAADEKGAGVERGTDGATHGTDAERGLQPRLGNWGRDEGDADSGSAGAAMERGGTSGDGTVSKRGTERGTEGLSEGEPATETGGGSGSAAVKKARKPEARYTRNFRYDEQEGNEADTYTPSQRLEANVKAIETLAEVLFGDKPATDEQRAIMSRFRGWGQVDLGKYYYIEHILRETFSHTPINRLARAIQKLDPQGDKKLFDAIKRASLSSYYTPTPIARAMNTFLSLAGYKGGALLDPSMGNGMYEGTLPKSIQERTAITGVELDWLSGQLSRQLYPDANVIIGGFEKSGIAPGSFDVVTSNVPFGDIVVNDPTWKNDATPLKRSAQNRIHNYYAVKMLEAARPGGLVAMLTTSAVMDTPSNQNIRAHIADQGEILGAIRLPDNTFQGTGVVTDILFIRKWRDDQDRARTREDAAYKELEQAFLSHFEKTAPNKLDGKEEKVQLNGYFEKNPRNLIGEVQAGNQYGKRDAFGLTSKLSVEEIASEIEKAIKRIVGSRRGNVFNPTRTIRETQQAVREAYKGEGDWVSNGNLVIQDGKVGVLSAKRNEYGEVTRMFEAAKAAPSKKELERTEAMISVRTAMKKLIAGQIEGAKEQNLTALRTELQKAYDNFVGKYGRLRDKENSFILDDIDGYTLQALERWKNGKFEGLSDIFTKNSIKPALKLDGKKTPQEAVALSLAEYGYLRPDYLAKALGEDWAEQCGDFVFLKPNSEEDYVTRDEYLSGDVVSKLAEARAAAEKDKAFERNVKALEEVQPERIPFDDIAIHLGARWIPESILNDFVNDLFGIQAVRSNRNGRWDPEKNEYVYNQKSGVRYIPETDSFEINIEKKELGGAAQDWETPKKSAKEILQAALEDKTMLIKTKDKEGNEHIDEEQTELANQKIADLRERFESWLPSDPERVETLEQTYNDRFNRTVIRHFNGSHLVVPGLMGKELRPHQKDAVWMLINNRGGIVDHIVGAGKTLVMQSAIMEMRRMGIAKKPMIVALKSTVSQIAREFKEAFPTARVLAPNDSDFKKENRKKFIANISLNDYDCIILSHEQYCMLPHTEEAERAVIDEQLWQLNNMIEYLYGTNDKSQMTKKQIKALEKRRNNLTATLEKRLDRNVDREFCFENLGVDYMFVDESHQFKSLPYVTSYQKVAGLGDAQGSSRAVALLTGIRHLQRMHQGDKGTVFLSGTTITNSLVEIYNLLNYLRPRKLEELGMPTFDAWASTFAVHTAELEAGVTGTFAMKDRFRSFDNVPELSQLYAEIADVRNDTNLKLPKPAVDGRTVIVPASNSMQEINAEIVKMLESKDGSYFGIHPKDPNRAPWGFHASTLSAKAAVSPRLIFPDMEDDGGKVHAVCENVKKFYDEQGEQRGVQLIFCEMGVPDKSKKYDAYTDMVNRFVNDYGIPRSEIAYIQEANTEEKRKDLFQRVRDGKVRILIGGTKNMGTGVNVQDRITDMHMLTVPWTPSALEQCIGRGARQGNLVARDFMDNKVRVHYYATEGSLDLYKYQLLDAKGKMFTQFKMGTVNGGRSFDEGSADEDGNIDPAEMVAILSGNPVIFERAKQEKVVKKLRALRNGFERDYQRKKSKQTELQAREERLARLVSLNERDRADLAREGFKPDDKGVYPTKFSVMEGYSRYGGRTFDKPKEGGEYLLKMLEEGKDVTLQGFGQRAKVVTVNEEGAGGLFSSYRVLQIGDGERNIKYTVRLSDDATAAGTAFRNLLKRIIDNGEVFKRDLDETKRQLAGMNIGDGVFPKQAELDEAVAKFKELNAEYNKLGKKPDAKDGNKYRLVEEGEELDWLESLGDDELVHVYRNVQILPDGSMASPMAAYNVETGEIRRLSPGRWNGPEERQIILTPEQEEKLAALKRDGYVINDKGKQEEFYQISKEMRFFKTKKEGVKLQFNLTRAGSKDMWADYNPYDHAIKVMLNDQFKAAWKRPNLVVVEAVMPKSEIEGGYKAPYAALPTGEHKWNNGRSLYLSRWSKIVRIVPFAEVAADIDRYWRENPSAYKGAKVTDYDRFQPQVREELEKLGYRFEDKGKRGELSEAELQKAYKSENATYITNEDIDRMNAEMQEAWHETPATERALAPNPKSEAEAERLVMTDRVEELADKLNTPVRIITNETELQAVSEDGKPRYSRRERRAKGWWSSKTGEVVVVLPNNVNVADVENTVVHEVVGHKGLRAFIGEERFDEFLGEVYNHASNPIRAKIDKETDRMVSEEADRLRERKRKAHERAGEDYNSTYYSDMAEARVEAEKKREEYRREATEEYMSDLGGRIGDEGFEKMSQDELTLWGKIKAKVQGFLDKFLRGLKIAKSIRLNDKDLSYILFKSWKNTRERGVFAEAEDAVRRSKSGYDADTQTRFRDGDMGLEEAITKMKADAAAANGADFAAKQAAMRAIGGNLSKLRQAMARQREYDITTVKSMTDLSKILLDAGLLDDLSKYETKRILSAIKDAVGREDTSKQVERLMDIMVDNQLRMGANYFGKLLSVKGSRIDARGIEVQGELDPDGQKIAQTVKKATTRTLDDIENMMAEAMNRMSRTDQAVADEAALEYAGLQIAHQYAEEIRESKSEERDLAASIKEAQEEYKLGNMTRDAYLQYKAATEEAIRQNKIERAEAYQSLTEQLGGVLGESVERAKQWREAEKQRVEEIHHNANSDMEGRPTNEHHKADRLQKFVNNDILRFLLAPLGTFDQMLRMFGSKSVRGEGYLWNLLMRGWVDCTEKEYIGYQEALKTLDKKVSEVFGKDMKWGDLFAMVRRMPKAYVRFWDGGEMRDHELTQGNLLYIYMTDKMTDGRMKLRRMGITEEDVERIKDFVDPRFIELADWIQEEFLVNRRNKYNEVHKRMFGTLMAAIENYFPMKILANARMEDVDVAEPEAGGQVLPATSTGSIIKRKRNNLALDVTGADAFSVILDHIQQMERWAAFAEYNRDLNTLLSYKRFRNQVMNMTSVYGAGKTLWTNFRNVAAMAAGTYRPPIAPLDKAAVNVAKGVTAAKVSFRVFTALKQFLSMPAYVSDSNPIHLAANIANPYKAWTWSMENLPLFEKRWKSRMAGDPRLLKSDMDWKMWRIRIVEVAGRVGMSPNAFVDALTIAIGARSMYQTKLAKYKRYGYTPEQARKRALQDATILFNQTQQSSEGAFLSTMQEDRSWLSVLFTVFRNSSMSYTRQLYDAMRNIGHRLRPGYKGMTEEFMAKQMRRDGIDPDQADWNAKQEYRRGIIRDLVRLGVFGYALQLAWNLGAYLPYLLFGKNADEKDKMWDDVLNHSMFGNVEGLTGGDVMSAAGEMWMNGEWNPEQLTKDMPLASDVVSILRKMDKDYVSAMNDVVNLLVQSGLGFNPQSLTDAAVAVMDYCGEDAQTSRECALLISRIINCPQSQIDKIYFDEIDATGEEAATMTPEEIAERYAEYKLNRNAPLTGWAYDEEGRKKAMDKQRKKAKKAMKERMTSTVANQRTRELLEGFEEVSERERELNRLKKRDREAYRRGRRELREGTDMRRHNRVKRYNHDIKRLTEKWMSARTPEEADSIARAMVNARERMLIDVESIEAQ